MNSSQMIWVDQAGEGRNVFSLFLRRFHLKSLVESVPFHLFADSLYRLRVNGKIVGFGPARFIPSHPEYDSYELNKWLRVGENTILVEVNSRGAPCYQAVQSRGGFVACGTTHFGDGSLLDFSTPGEWQCLASQAWEQNAEPFSFAQGPVEILDQTKLPAGYPSFLNGTGEDEWQRPVELSEPGHWGKFSARAIPMPSLQPLAAQQVVLAAGLSNGLTRQGFNAGNVRLRVRQPFFTHIHSVNAQEIDLGIFWGPVYVNGEKLTHSPCERRGNRENARATLRAGWNFIYGLPEVIQPYWSWLMDFPSSAGLVLRALPDHACLSSFALAPVSHLPLKSLASVVPTSLAEVVNYPEAWRMVPMSATSFSPAREMSWDLVGEVWEKNFSFPGEWDLPASPDGATLVLDFGGEYLGHFYAEFETETGTVVDVGYDELLRKDGTLAFFRRNPYVNAADRFICASGVARIEAFHERGGRYVQLTFRGSTGPIRLKQVGILQTTVQHEVCGNFHCGDDLLNWTWEAGQRTIEAGLSDGWLDSPWRERGMYVGDVLVEAAVTRKLIDDWRLEPWAIRLFARSQLPNGQIRDVVPSDRATPLFDYSLLWIQILRDYWAATGDLDLVREVWPTVGRIFNSPAWKPNADGLWAVEGPGAIFVSWGARKEEKVGVNGVLNAFRFRALECAAELAEAMGLVTERETYFAQARAVRKAFRRAFWDEKTQRFGACILDGVLVQGPSLHVNTLALAYGLGDANQEPAVIAYLLREIPKNTLSPEGHIDLYFLSYLLAALYRVGRADWAETVIRQHYGIMQEHGAWTLWETLNGGRSGHHSFCHGWSAGPSIFFSERVLGVRQFVPGDPSQILIAPESATLEWAQGTVPHPRGLIQVSWRIEDSQLLLALNLPEGVDAHIQPAGRLSNLTMVRLPYSSLAPLPGLSPLLPELEIAH